jgi:hypothetical protein
MLTAKPTLGLSSTAVGAIATVYLAGEVVGALAGSALTALTAGNTTAWVAYMYLTRLSPVPASAVNTRPSTRRSMS